MHSEVKSQADSQAPSRKGRDYSATPWFCLRWATILPATIVLALVAFRVDSFILAIGNFFGGMWTSATIGLFASAFAGIVAVVSAKMIAPNAKDFVGATVAVAVCLVAIQSIGNVATGEIETQTPSWYLILMYGALAAGAVSSAFNSDGGTENRIPIRATSIVRWTLFIPIALVLAILLIAPLVAIEAFLPHRNTTVELILSEFLSAVALIGVGSAIAPSGQRIVVCFLAGLWIIGGSLKLLAAISPQVFLGWMQTHYPDMHIVVDAGNAWVIALHGCAWISAAVLSIVFTFRRAVKAPDELNSSNAL